MLRLRVVQAEFGDCLILEFGTKAEPKYMLVDGGPDGVYSAHLRPELLRIRDSGGKIELAVLSHVDNDHAVGLLDLMADLRAARANGTPEAIRIDALWHNSFAQTVARGTDIEERLTTLLASARSAGQIMSATGMVVQGISEGNQLRVVAAMLGLPLNSGFDGGIITQDVAPAPIGLGNLQMRIVGPTVESLKKLKKEWLRWLDTHEDQVASGAPMVAEKIDSSVPNLSSIMVWVEADGKKLLLTGDGLGEDLIQGLRKAGLLDPAGRGHVDLLKLPHHGSERNVTKKLFETITADQYVISANGRYGNPDLSTLIWLVEAARDRGQPVELLATNETDSTRKLLQEYSPSKYGYRLTLMDRATHTMVAEISPP